MDMTLIDWVTWFIDQIPAFAGLVGAWVTG